MKKSVIEYVALKANNITFDLTQTNTLRQSNLRSKERSVQLCMDRKWHIYIFHNFIINNRL